MSNPQRKSLTLREKYAIIRLSEKTNRAISNNKAIAEQFKCTEAQVQDVLKKKEQHRFIYNRKQWYRTPEYTALNEYMYEWYKNESKDKILNWKMTQQKAQEYADARGIDFMASDMWIRRFSLIHGISFQKNNKLIERKFHFSTTKKSNDDSSETKYNSGIKSKENMLLLLEAVKKMSQKKKTETQGKTKKSKPPTSHPQSSSDLDEENSQASSKISKTNTSVKRKYDPGKNDDKAINSNNSLWNGLTWTVPPKATYSNKKIKSTATIASFTNAQGNSDASTSDASTSGKFEKDSMDLEAETIQEKPVFFETEDFSSKESSPCYELLVKEEPTIDTEPIDLLNNQNTPALNTYTEALEHLQSLDDFALMKENFRMIGLIERMQDIIKESMEEEQGINQDIEVKLEEFPIEE